MARTACRPEPVITKDLSPRRQHCLACGQRMWLDYTNRRTVVTLAGCTRLNLAIRRCHHPGCERRLRPYRPEGEGRIALPKHEFGLDVIALVGALRYAEHRSVPEIHRALRARDVGVSQRTVTNLLDRYDELLAVALTDDRRLRKLLADQGRVVLAIDGLQPDVGHEVLWVLRDCLSGEVLLARSLLSARQEDLATLLRQVRDAVGVPVVGVVSDGQQSIRKAVAQALPGVPHQLCQFHYLREAARPIYEADRHAKKELKKKVRAVRGIERSVEGRDDPQAEVIRGYCSAVRSALTDDGRPPLQASGLRLHDRLQAVADSLERVEEKGGAGATAPAQRPDRAGPERDRRLVAGDPAGVRLGAPGGPHPGRRRHRRRDGTAASGRAAGRDGRPARPGGRLGGGGGPLRQGQPELLAGAVLLLRGGGPAAHQQRLGAVVRQLPAPRAAGERAEGGLAGVGLTRRGSWLPWRRDSGPSGSRT
jgi:hypothetical protein